MSCIPYYLYQPSYCYDQCYYEPKCRIEKCQTGCGCCPSEQYRSNSIAFLGAIAGDPTTGIPYKSTIAEISFGTGFQQQITSFTTSFVSSPSDYIVNQSAGTITILNNGYYDVALTANIVSTSITIDGIFITTSNNSSNQPIILSSFINLPSNISTGVSYNAKTIIYLPAGTILYTYFAYPSNTETKKALVSGNWISIFVRKVT